MDWNKLQQQLAREASEYLADLRDMRDGLRSVEGWITLGLLIVAVLMTAAWFIVALRFNPANDHVSAFVASLGLRSCRSIDNFSGVILFVDMILLVFLTVISLGNVLNMMRQVKERQPRESRDLIISTSLLLLVGLGGIAFMLWVC